jgi:uncharacterized GH25 family protein
MSGARASAARLAVAHNYIIKHWHDLHDGDVVDVEWILGETKQKKISERVTEPL